MSGIEKPAKFFRLVTSAGRALPSDRRYESTSSSSSVGLCDATNRNITAGVRLSARNGRRTRLATTSSAVVFPQFFSAEQTFRRGV